MDMKPKRTIKDSVFTDLFTDSRYIVQLYDALFPEEDKITENDITKLTLKNVLVHAMYNDLGFMVKDKMIVLVEAQSTWTMNILVRLFLYLAETYHEYILSNKLDVYTEKKMVLPCPEMFVIYTGERKIDAENISLAEEFFGGRRGIDINVKVLTSGQKNDIIYQYVTFTKVLHEQIGICGRTKRAVAETIRICKNKDILKEYLSRREEEVMDMMSVLFDEDTINEIHDWNTFNEGRAEGMEVGKAEGMEVGVNKILLELADCGAITEALAASRMDISPAEFARRLDAYRRGEM